MITADSKTLVTQSFAQAIERMAFLDVLPCLETPSVPAGGILLAEIRFRGPAVGAVQIAAGMDFAGELVANMGLIDHPTEEQCLDALKELVNVTCGLVLPLLAPPDLDQFDVTIPHDLTNNEIIDWSRWIRQEDVAVLDVGGYPIGLRLVLESCGG